MKPWPDNAFLQGYYEPLTTECTAPDLIVEGEIPKDLNGTFYRNGPNPQFAPEREYHFLLATAWYTPSILTTARSAI